MPERICPQAYAYASGRPLVNTDPTGTTVEVSGSWAGAWSWMFYNAQLGHVAQRLHNDTKIHCKVREANYAMLASHGGAINDTDKGGASGCDDQRGEWTITIDYNPQMMQNFLQTKFPGVPYSAEAALVHELTHSYFSVITDTEDFPSDSLSVQYENSARAQLGLPLRPYH